MVGVRVICRNALGKVDNCQFGALLVDHKVELVEIAMDEPAFGKFNQ